LQGAYANSALNQFWNGCSTGVHPRKGGHCARELAGCARVGWPLLPVPFKGLRSRKGREGVLPAAIRRETLAARSTGPVSYRARLAQQAVGLAQQGIGSIDGTRRIAIRIGTRR